MVVECGAGRHGRRRGRPRDLLDHRARASSASSACATTTRCASRRRSSPARCSTAPPACRRTARRSTRCTTRAPTPSTRSCPSGSWCASATTRRSTWCAGSRAASRTGLGAAMVRAEVVPGSSVVVVGAGGVGPGHHDGRALPGRDHDRRRRPASADKVEKALELGLATHGVDASTHRPGGGGARAHRRAVAPTTDSTPRGSPGTLDQVMAATRPGRDVRGHRPLDGRGRRDRRHHRAAAPARAHRHLRRVDPSPPSPPRVRRPVPRQGRLDLGGDPRPPVHPRRGPAGARRPAPRAHDARRHRRGPRTRRSGSDAVAGSISFDEIESREGFLATGEKPTEIDWLPEPAAPAAPRHAHLGRRPPGGATGHVRGPRSGQVRRRRATRDDRGRRPHRVLALRRPAALQGRAQRGGRQAAAPAHVRPDPVRRDAPRRVRHPRARARHGPQRRVRVVVLPVVARRLRRASATSSV